MSTVAAVSVVLSALDIEHRQGTPCEADPELFCVPRTLIVGLV